ncbi:hypothetical protein BJX68DRAFT_264833 [Aspergillus pseudodeflectus]|uniref:Uncharacterized protein n=1 Tax=Aspergillus pseudodeflectus TaxID=176178 RepID=A0ABR4KPX5_9EURO
MRILHLLIPSMLSILAAGAPAPEANAEANIESHANHARFGYSGGDTCTGPVYQFDSTGGCYPVSSPARSIYVYESVGCQISSWSGLNCRGSSKVISATGCTSVLFGSIKVQC